MTKSEELSIELLRILDRTQQPEQNSGRHMVREFLESYGRLVQEAAAKVAEKSADSELDDYAAGGAYSAAEAVKRMPLP